MLAPCQAVSTPPVSGQHNRPRKEKAGAWLQHSKDNCRPNVRVRVRVLLIVIVISIGKSTDPRRIDYEHEHDRSLCKTIADV